MRRSTWLTALAVVLAIGGAQVSQAQTDNSQQNKMTSCNADATTQGLKGDDRKAYMKTCLSKAKNSQQEKMKSCNADATTKGLKGDDRKAYMKTCLSGSSTGH
jgi:uncharacterized protein HemX